MVLPSQLDKRCLCFSIQKHVSCRRKALKHLRRILAFVPVRMVLQGELLVCLKILYVCERASGNAIGLKCGHLMYFGSFLW